MQGVKIVHESEFDSSYLMEYDDVEYFRLYHPLQNIDKINLTDIRIETSKSSDIPAIAGVIRGSSDCIVRNISRLIKKE